MKRHDLGDCKVRLEVTVPKSLQELSYQNCLEGFAEKAHLGVADIPDPRLAVIASFITTRKVVPATIKLVDIPGDGAAALAALPVAHGARVADDFHRKAVPGRRPPHSAIWLPCPA